MVNLEAELPAPSSERIAVHVTSDALRQVRGGHPWIWDGSIVRASAQGAPGDLAVIFDDKRKFAAIGLWDPDAPIAVRVLHQGAPRAIDAAFFADKLLTAFAHRQPLHDGPIGFYEHGLQFEADVERGQKTGHFLDQRDNRHLIGTRCEDARVLDVFCNSGGFSVYAAAAGARSVHSIDVSEHAIKATSRHIELNRVGLGFETEHTTQVADAFEAMEELADHKWRFDVVIVDPPSFAPNSASAPAARRAYRRLTSLAVELLASGGTLFQASCSSRIPADEFYALVTGEIVETDRKAIHTIRTGHALDHPIGFEQGAYLKAVLTDVVPARS